MALIRFVGLKKVWIQEEIGNNFNHTFIRLIFFLIYPFYLHNLVKLYVFIINLTENRVNCMKLLHLPYIVSNNEFYEGQYAAKHILSKVIIFFAKLKIIIRV